MSDKEMNKLFKKTITMWHNAKDIREKYRIKKAFYAYKSLVNENSLDIMWNHIVDGEFSYKYYGEKNLRRKLRRNEQKEISEAN